MEGMSVKSLHQLTQIDRWFLHQINDIVSVEKQLQEHDLESVPAEL